MVSVDHYWVYESMADHKEYAISLENYTCDPNEFDKIKPEFDNSIEDFLTIYHVEGRGHLGVKIIDDFFDISIDKKDEITIYPKNK